MFAAETKAIVKSLGAKTLIPNKNINQDLDLLSVVLIKPGRFWEAPKYKVLECTLPELMEEKMFSPVVEEKILVKDFKTFMKTGGECELKGGHEAVAEAAISVNVDVVDALAQPVSIKKKRVDLKTVREKFGGRMFKKDTLKKLKLKKEKKLAFVYEMAYNTDPVTMIRMGNQNGSISGSYHSMVKVNASVKKKEDTKFTLEGNTTFAYSLVEIRLENEKIEIPFETWTPKRGLFADALSSDIKKQVRNEIKNKKNLLKPIEDLPESTRGDLLKKLREVLEEEDALNELEDALDQSSQGPSEPPTSKAVCSFMNLLDESKVSTQQNDALHILVMAMEVLPVEALQILTSGSRETLAILRQLVESLRDEGEACLPASLPVPLQQDGELRWAADLLCSSDETLTELSESWDRPPEVLLEVLALTVLGVHKLQPRE